MGIYTVFYYTYKIYKLFYFLLFHFFAVKDLIGIPIQSAKIWKKAIIFLYFFILIKAIKVIKVFVF